MIEQRPGQKIFTVPGPDWGVRVIEPAAMPADWWDPDNEGLSVVGAYRAINSVGTPWPGGPANYAESLINQANPGTFDLVEGNGAVPWAAATGWGFVAAALQYFDTGLIPAADQSWSGLVQFANVTNNGVAFGKRSGPANQFFYIQPDNAGIRVVYGNGAGILAPPRLLTGNLGMAGANCYRNGAFDVGPMGGWTGPSTRGIYIGAYNNSGVLAFCISANIHAAVFYDATLTGPQVLTVATAMAAL